MDTLQHAISQLSTKFMERMESFESELQKGTSSSPSLATLTAEFSSFKDFVLASLHALQDQLNLLTQSMDHVEVQTRRKILLFHGIPEEKQEDVGAMAVKTIVDRLKIDGFQHTDISRCHRMGKSTSGGKPRPILVKLRETTVRNDIWYAKTKLKGSGVTVSEFLTKARHDLFMQARKKLGISKCWTRDGTIYALGPDATKYRIDSFDVLDSVAAQTVSDQLTATQTTGRHATTVVARARRAATRK